MQLIPTRVYELRKKLSVHHLIRANSAIDVVTRTLEDMSTELAISIVEHSPDLDGEEDTLP